MKQCKGCKTSKELTEFYKLSKSDDGKDYYCKVCRNYRNSKSWYTKESECNVQGCNKNGYAKDMCKTHYNRFLRTGSTEKRYESYREDRKYINSAGYEVSAKLFRESHLRRTYNITLEEFEEKAKNGCECCGQKSDYTYHVDHDHACCSGKTSCGQCVRGAVCGRCNQAIWAMEAKGLNTFHPNYQHVVNYLEKYGKIVTSSVKH